MGDRLAALRAEAGISQSELARRASMKQPVISALERGERWTPTNLETVAGALGVSPAVLVDDIEPAGAPRPPGHALTSTEAAVIRVLREDGPKAAVLMLMSYLKSRPLP